MTLGIVLDVSASMGEMAKARIETLVLDCIDHDTDAHPHRVFHWGETLEEVDEKTPITPTGKAVFSALAPLLSREKGILLLTDGTWPQEEIQALRQGADAAMNCTLRIIAIGGDADFFCLEKLAGKGAVYGPEDLFIALEAFDGMD